MCKVDNFTYDSNCFYLHVAIPRQTRNLRCWLWMNETTSSQLVDLKGRSGWLVVREELAVDVAHLSEVPNVP